MPWITSYYIDLLWFMLNYIRLVQIFLHCLELASVLNYPEYSWIALNVNALNCPCNYLVPCNIMNCLEMVWIPLKCINSTWNWFTLKTLIFLELPQTTSNYLIICFKRKFELSGVSEWLTDWVRTCLLERLSPLKI